MKIKHFIEKTDEESVISNKQLLDLIPKEQIDKVFKQDMIDIDIFFMGFVDTYYHLAHLIPKDFTVIDLGCAYNAQCFYFKDHKKYIAVDFNKDTIRFKSDNCDIIISTIENFIKNELNKYDLDKTFAILNYVPPWGADNNKLVRDNFKNLYVFYPK